MTYIEDYLELMATSIPLAENDDEFIKSFVKLTVKRLPLTERQGWRAIELIKKYSIELSNNGVNVQVDLPKFRQPLRIIDSTDYISIEGDIVIVHFRYEPKLVNDIRKYRDTSIGSVIYNREEIRWEFSLTEVNLTWVVTWGRLNNFIIDSMVTMLHDKILECESTPYSIKLVSTDTGYTITNAAQSLLDYIDTHLGGFGSNNVTTLVDYAGILGYQVDESITQVDPLVQVFSPRRTEYLRPTVENLESVMEYAVKANRYPVVIQHRYARLEDELMLAILKLHDNSDIVITQNLNKQLGYSSDDVKYGKIILPSRIQSSRIKNLPSIPLVISYCQLLMRDSLIANAAERIIYMCDTKIIDD